MKQELAIIGGGACAIFLANQIDTNLFAVTVYEKNNSIARKFLVAGHGGLNLTHSEAPEDFLKRYTPNEFIKPAFLPYSNIVFREWLHTCGIDTKVGSSGRVFPAGKLKPAQVLEILRKRAEDRGVIFKYKHEWKGFDANKALIFENDSKQFLVAAEHVVFCLGGASWPVTGSKGDWLDYFKQQNISTLPFEASNCTLLVDWPLGIKQNCAGKPLKNCLLTCNELSRLGEFVITEHGLEGSGVYPLSPQIRAQLKAQGKAKLFVDLKPGKSQHDLVEQLSTSGKNKSITELLKSKVVVSATAIQVLKTLTTKSEFSDPLLLAAKIKALPISITGMAPIEEAISTVGGIALDEVDENFEVKKLPNRYVIGEMLDFDAPTGGYLLQACFTMAMFVADNLKFSLVSGKKS